jgi:hypothetical protein
MAGPTYRARAGITGVDSRIRFHSRSLPPRAISLVTMAAANPGGGGGSVAARPPGDDTYEGDESGGGYHTGGGASSPGRMRAHLPAHRAAAALCTAVYNSPAKTSHRWASAFGAVE